MIFDCRAELGKPHWGEAQFKEAHLPGAQFLHLDRDLSAPVTPDSGRHPLPDPKLLAQRFAALGVHGNSQVIAYDQGPGAYAARAWWLLRWLGHARVAVLDGGIAAWRTLRLPLASAVNTPVARHFSLTVDSAATVTSERVNVLRLLPGNLLVDARGAERFAGRNEIIDPVAGHVPGARNHAFTLNLGTDGKFLPVDELRQRWQTMLGSLPPGALIAMCGSGVTACHNLLALEHAGMPGARLYDGSWSEWIRDPGRAIGSGAY